MSTRISKSLHSIPLSNRVPILTFLFDVSDDYLLMVLRSFSVICLFLQYIDFNVKDLKNTDEGTGETIAFNHMTYKTCEWYRVKSWIEECIETMLDRGRLEEEERADDDDYDNGDGDGGIYRGSRGNDGEIWISKFREYLFDRKKGNKYQCKENDLGPLNKRILISQFAVG